MVHVKLGYPLTSYGICVATILFFSCIPAFGADPIDGFRDLKFGMSPQEAQALPNCSTPQECMYELSNKNRYIRLSYGPDDLPQDLEANQTRRLEKITIDMGQYSEDWYQQLQMILGTSYRLTQDFTDDTLNAFLDNQQEELNAGYEDGQVVLMVTRRRFGNMILKVIYQTPARAAAFFPQSPPPSTATP